MKKYPVIQVRVSEKLKARLDEVEEYLKWCKKNNVKPSNADECYSVADLVRAVLQNKCEAILQGAVHKPKKLSFTAFSSADADEPIEIPKGQAEPAKNKFKMKYV